MTSLFIVSTETFSGKTALAAGLMRHLRDDGYTVGYMKPISTTPRVSGTRLADADAQFIKETFDLPAPLSKIVPVKLTASAVEKAVRGGGDLPGKVQAAFEGLEADVDVLILEGGGNLSEGALFGLSVPEIADMLGVPVLAVTRYTHRLSGDDVLLAHRVLGERMIGAVVNAVPSRELELFSEMIVPILQSQGVAVLGMLPRERLLTAATVRELADGINGRIIIAEERADELVENLSVGAMGVDNALAYFRRKTNKAVITGGDRSDILLAALQTSTRCLILTGNLQPSPLIVAKAEELGVPVVMSQRSTLETVETINQFFGRTRFHEAPKLGEFRAILEANFNFGQLYRELGLS